MTKPELLAPAGNLAKLKIALAYGADAVYLGGKRYGLRALGGNFTEEEMAEGVAYAHSLGKKVYVAVNIFPHNEDLPDLPDYLRFLQDIQADALLVADLGVFSLAREIAPRLKLHVSTQANVTNFLTAKTWEKLGASRLVLARELSLAEIKNINEHTAAELEIFVHGAMCVSYSGRCLLSAYLTDRDANRGNCAQPCRWRYALTEEKRPGQFFPVSEDERGTYIFNSKDLCLLPYLPQIVAAGVASLKIEGRMKSVHYAATVTKVYREAIDGLCRNPAAFRVEEKWLRELNKISHRQYTTGFIAGKPGAEGQIYSSAAYEQTAEFLGVVLDYDEVAGMALVEQRNKLVRGQRLEIMPPQGEVYSLPLKEMYDSEGHPIDSAPHPRQLVKIPLKAEPFTILRGEKK